MRVLLTGGAGFIGSVVLAHLNKAGFSDVIIVDALGKSDKWKNLVGKSYSDLLCSYDFVKRLKKDQALPDFDSIIHLGASTSTTERDADSVVDNNFRFSCLLRELAGRKSLRFVYASSGATYGSGKHGFDDDALVLHTLRPLNIYGYSKHMFDLWMTRNNRFENAVGLKFFNVFGPNEYHKEDMASVVFKSFERLEKGEKISLFRSYHKDYKDGEQLRDFIYVKDVADIVVWSLTAKSSQGILNVGTGQARSWKDMAHAIYSARGQTPEIKYIDMPESLRDRYQYKTEAKVERLRAQGYDKPFTSLEEAVRDYVVNYLSHPWPYL